ncbi:hypothetical protein VLK31_15555 [Variovorax sp. H27-G14]|uniref:hypothetical protein n=1 Tax=Variovorax sp. H27-G14 TaxID=3111914 RepID=UPI0038FC536A
MAIFHKDFAFSSGLVRLGRGDSGIAAVPGGRGGDFGACEGLMRSGGDWLHSVSGMVRSKSAFQQPAEFQQDSIFAKHPCQADIFPDGKLV